MSRISRRVRAAVLGLMLVGALVAQAVVAAPSATAVPLASISVTASTASSVSGQSVTFTANLAGTGTTPTGTVDFLDDGDLLCTASPLGQAPGGAPLAVAECTTDALTVGTHPITAHYNGDATYDAETSAPPLSHVVANTDTTIALASEPNPSVFSESITLTATVAAAAPGAGTPTGDVAFAAGGLLIAGCAARPLTAGVATCSTSALVAASHDLEAFYDGEAPFNPSDTVTATVQLVNEAPTTTAVATSDSTVLVGQSVTFTATTSATAPATLAPSAGSVSFNRDGTPIAGCTAQTVTSGVATCATADLPVGTGQITAVYTGSSNYADSTSPGISQIVSLAATTTSLEADPAPSVFTELVTLTATVLATAPAAGTPPGTVSFRTGGIAIAGCDAQPLADGSAECTTAALPVGTDALTAVYSGSTDYSSSTSPSVDHTVGEATTTTVVAVDDTTTTWGQPVVLTATISPDAPATIAPSAGTVRFESNGSAITGCEARPVADGVATCSADTLPVGSTTIAVEYSGTPDFADSTSASFVQAVSRSATTVALASSINPAAIGDSVTFTATVLATAPSSGVPTGTVAFFRVRSDLTRQWLGTEPLIAGVATVTADSLPVGAHTIRAVYRASPSSVGSTTTLVQTVRARAETTTTLTSTRPSAVAGRFIAFHATVASTPSINTPAGTVAFFRIRPDMTRVWIGNVALQDGVAKLRTSSIPIGTHRILAIYRGERSHFRSFASVVQRITAG